MKLFTSEMVVIANIFIYCICHINVYVSYKV